MNSRLNIYLQAAFLRPIYVLVFFLLTFVNDYAILDGSIYLYYFLWFSIILLRFLGGLKFVRSEIISQTLLALLLSPIFVVSVYYNALPYINYMLFAILYINALQGFKGISEYGPSLPISRGFWLLGILLFIIAIYLFSSSGGRTTILFGPNTLYRLLPFVFCIIVIFTKVDFYKSSNLIFIFIAMIFTLVSMATTGSRGAVIVIGSYFLYFVLFGGRLGIGTIARIIIGGIILGLTFAFMDLIELLFWRLVNFDPSGDSISVRESYASDAYLFINRPDSFLDLLFGVSQNNELWDNYPHNYLFEFLVYGGIWFLSIFLIPLLLFSFSILLDRQKKDSLFLLFLPFFIGGLASGDLAYNFPVLSILYFLIVIKRSGVRLFGFNFVFK